MVRGIAPNTGRAVAFSNSSTLVILLLSKYQEKKYHEIGEILGVTEGAVKVKVFRALQELKVIYKQLEKSH